MILRARAKITSYFYISASAHLWLIPQLEQENLKRFRAMAADSLGDDAIHDLALSWEGLFRYITAYSKRQKKKTIIIIDEFQYLVKSNTAIPSIFQVGYPGILKI